MYPQMQILSYSYRDSKRLSEHFQTSKFPSTMARPYSSVMLAMNNINIHTDNLQGEGYVLYLGMTWVQRELLPNSVLLS